MSENNPPTVVPVVLTFLAGAAIGAIVVALTTPKSGPRLRKELKDLARCGEGRAEDVAQHLPEPRKHVKKPAGSAPGDLKRGRKVSVSDLPGRAR
jgi:gas vesicle protein